MEETKFFKDGKVKINVKALAIRHASLRTTFELHGSYAPRDAKEAAQYGVRVIRVDIPRPLNEYNQFIDTIPKSAVGRHGLTNGAKPAVPGNGKPRTDRNGHG